MRNREFPWEEGGEDEEPKANFPELSREDRIQMARHGELTNDLQNKYEKYRRIKESEERAAMADGRAINPREFQEEFDEYLRAKEALKDFEWQSGITGNLRKEGISAADEKDDEERRFQKEADEDREQDKDTYGEE